ncbi:DUF2469 family protein, partial [Streptomyces nigra]
MSAEDLEKYETEMELKLYREYRDVVGLFKYVIETERRFYLTNDYEMQVHSVQGEVFFEGRDTSATAHRARAARPAPPTPTARMRSG